MNISIISICIYRFSFVSVIKNDPRQLAGDLGYTVRLLLQAPAQFLRELRQSALGIDFIQELNHLQDLFV